MRRFLAFALLLMGVSLANAQAPTVICTPTTGGSCIPVNASNPLPIAGSFSATLTGFLSNGLFATLTATNTTSASTALPTGATANPSVRITNNGTTAVSCTMATGAATGVANNILVQPGSSVSRVVGTFVNIACIDQTGSVSNPVVIEGGSGLGNDSGGGGGGGGGSSITTWAGGTLGAMALYGTSPGPVLVPGNNVFVTGSNLGLAQGSATAGQTGTLNLGAVTTSAPGYITAQSSPLSLDPLGNLRIVTSVGISGGATPYTPFVPVASDNHQVVKNGVGTSYSITTSNNSATKNYLRLYDVGTGFNGCNSATGVIFAMEIPPNDSGFSVLTGGINGLSFSNGLSVCITSGFGLTDTTAATASAMYVNIAFK